MKSPVKVAGTAAGSVSNTARRAHTGHLFAVHHGKMADALLLHQGEALVHGVFEVRAKHLLGHDLAHLGAARGLAAQLDLARVVALREDAGEALALHHDHRADVALGHQLQRCKHRIVRLHGEHAGDLLRLKQLAHGPRLFLHVRPLAMARSIACCEARRCVSHMPLDCAASALMRPCTVRAASSMAASASLPAAVSSAQRSAKRRTRAASAASSSARRRISLSGELASSAMRTPRACASSASCSNSSCRRASASPLSTMTSSRMLRPVERKAYASERRFSDSTN